MIFGVETAAQNNGMDMWMKVHLTPPCVEDADVANVSTEIFAVGSQFSQCIG